MKGVRILTLWMVLVVTCVCLCCGFVPVTAADADAIGSISLHVTAPDTNEPLEKAGFHLYYVAALKEENGQKQFVYVSPYDESNMELGDLQDSALPVHLTHFAQTRSLSYTEKSTDKNGALVFDGLLPGVYLMVPSADVLDTYSVSPFLVSLPHYDETKQVWTYAIDATPKMGVWQEKGEDTTYISVSKTWSTNQHPDSITAVLQCDLKEYDRVVLNEDNNWYYRWDDLPKNHAWTVVEDQVPDGYTVQYKSTANTVTIINQLETVETPPDEPEPEEPPLIQTGQWNWPVPVLATVGLLLFGIGWALLNLDSKETE